MRGRMLVVTVLAALASAAPARAEGQPIMALGDVRAGMRCTGLSVFHGTAVEPFDVEVLDVVGTNIDGEMEPRILVRVSGPAVDATGIGQGFSGSPVSCPGADGVERVIGAISETIGEYGGKVVLATPIEQMLATPVDGTTPPRARALPRLEARARPLASPLSVRGLAPSLFKPLARAAASRGVALVQAPPAPLAPPAAGPVVPGSAVAVGISSGDIAVGAVGTATYVDGDRVWAFGHPLDGAGARALLLQDAYVAAVVGNPLAIADVSGTYKLAGPVRDIGTLSDDGFDAVAGRTGALPPLIGVHVYATDADRGRRLDTNVRVADETDVGNPTGASGLSFVGPLAIAQAATGVMGATPLRMAGELCLRAAVRELAKPLRFCNRYVSDGTTASSDGSGTNVVALAGANDAAAALSLFDSFKGRPLHVTNLAATFTLTRGQRQAYLRRFILPRHVRAGATVPARVVVKVVRGATRTIRFRFHVPRRLSRSVHRFQLAGADPDTDANPFSTITIDLGDGGGPPDSEGPRTAAALAQAFRGFARYDGLRLKGTRTRVYRDATYRIGGRAATTATVTRR